MNSKQNSLSIISNFNFRGRFGKDEAMVALIPDQEITKQYQTLLRVPFVVIQQKYNLINNDWLLTNKQLIGMDKMGISNFPTSLEADHKWTEAYQEILHSKVSDFKESMIAATITSELVQMTRNYLYIKPEMPVWEMLFWLYGIKYQ